MVTGQWKTASDGRVKGFELIVFLVCGSVDQSCTKRAETCMQVKVFFLSEMRAIPYEIDIFHMLTTWCFDLTLNTAMLQRESKKHLL